MKALVTGGAGFIGSNVIKQWVALGNSAVVLDNLSSGYRDNVPAEVEFVKGDIRNISDIDRAVSGCDVIFNLAASVGNKRAIDDTLTDSEVNVIGVLCILEAARRHDIKKVVHSSSAAIFGEMITLPINEDHPQEPDTPYGVSKLAGEKHCLVYSKLYDLEIICLRYFNVYGPHQRFDAYGNVIPIFANRILKGFPLMIFGDGEQTRDFVNVQDVVAANIQSAQVKGVKGVFNIGSGTQITVNNLAHMMIQYSGISVDIEYGPPREGDVRDSLADISKAKNNFSYNPCVDIEAGLKEYLYWLRNDSSF